MALAVCLCVAVPAGLGQTSQPRPWLFVADRDYPPLSSIEDGVARGLDVDLVRELSRVLGREIRLELDDFSQARRRVLDGEADAVTDLGISPDRRELFDFSEATITHEFGLFVRRGDDSVHGLRDLSGKRVGVTTSPFAADFLARQADAVLVTVSDFDEGFRRLVAGSLDVVAFDIWVAAPKARSFAREIVLVGAPFATSATAIGVRKGNQDVLAEINRGIRRLKADGTLQRLEAEWRPREMTFLAEAFVTQVITWSAFGLLVILLAGVSYWVVTLKRRIRERQRVEAALAASEERFAKAFRASPHGSAIIDVETRRIVEANDRFVQATGYSREELIGRTGTELQMIASPEAAEAARETMLRTGSARDVEFQMRRKDGRILTVLGAGEHIELAGRRCSLWVFRDVTESRELEAKLLQSQKMDAVGRLAAGVAHDFNNLLTVILGNCEVGTSILAPEDPLRHPLTDIRIAAERAAALTRQLLAFSRRTIVRPRVLGVNDAVREFQPMLARLIGEDITVTLVLRSDAGTLEIDPGQLQQVLLNLAVNARDAMPRGGRLEFRTRRAEIDAAEAIRLGISPGDYVALEVSDTGAGIDAATRAQMFEPFFTTKEVGQGNGLGLATVHGIVTGSGGAIEVESTPGRGTTFHILWPRLGDVVTVRETERELDGTLPRGREAVVLVEDENDVRDLLRDYLGRLGYRVLAARSGDEAIDLCRRQVTPPDLLVTDVVMNGMSGRELADALRSPYPNMRVLYLSGYTDDAILRRGVRTSGVHFLQKPFSLAVLATTVRGILDGAPA